MTQLKKGDTVLVITGKDRGKTGTIISVAPSQNRAVVSGVNEYKKHVKRSAKNPQGGVMTAHRGLNISNLMFLDPETKKPTRLGVLIEGNTKRRISRLSGKGV